MNIQIKLTLVNLVFLTILACPTYAIAQQPFEGKWRHTEVFEETTNSQNCRLLHVIVRNYDLNLQPDSLLSGNYFRIFQPLWLGPINDCIPEFSPANFIKYYRSDVWSIKEVGRNGNSLSIHGEYVNCIGACSNGISVDTQFQTSLWQKDSTIIDIFEESGEQLIFIPESRAETSEQDAASHMFNLLKPIYEGECNRFYEFNMDPEFQANTPIFEFCQVIRKLTSLMPPILYNKPLSATYFSFAAFKGTPKGEPLHIWGGLDVLVEQNFVVDPDGGSVPVAAVLRMQPNNTWKVLVLFP